MQQVKTNKKELAKLKRIFKNIEPNKLKTVEKLIQNAAFMSQSLDDLQEIIKEKGYTEEYQNGANQYGTKKTCEIEIYNTMVKNYSSIIKQLIDLLPKEEAAADELLDFISGR